MSIISEIERCLVVMAHPDDEVLACGGTIAKLVSQGTTIHQLFLSDGEGSRRSTVTSESRLVREESCIRASVILGIKKTEILEFPDNEFDTVPLLDLIIKIEGVINEFRPQLIITHSSVDLNIDHKKTCEAVITAARPQSWASTCAVIGGEVLSSTEWSFCSPDMFKPDLFVDISAFTHLKTAALAAYSAELRSHPHPRSIEAITSLMSLRGSTIGVHSAEAFKLYYAIL